MRHERIRLLAAQLVLQSASQMDIVNLARHLLNDGVQAPELARLVQLSHRARRKIAPAELIATLGAALQEFGLGLPSLEDAGRLLVVHCFTGIYEWRLSPQEGLGIFGGYFARMGWRPLAQTIIDQLGCREFLAVFHQMVANDSLPYEGYDEVEWAARSEQVDQAVMAFVGRWLPSQFAASVESCRTVDVVGLATAIASEQDFDRLPILADALEDAGCTNADVLEHCRQQGEHARGCWVVDLLLDKC